MARMAINRREFLRRLPAAAAIILAHDQLASADPPSPRAADRETPASRPADDGPLIQSLRLLTAASLAEMTRFYRDTIGFKVLAASKTELTLAAGATTLTFVSARPEQIRGDAGRGRGEPMYHFAFNIPPSKIHSARTWQLERTPLIPPRRENRVPDYPDDVWDFRQWNSHSIFFWDPAFNIVEYIARHDLPSAADPGRVFTAGDILYASEIGFVFDRPTQARAAKRIHEQLGLREYPRRADPWWAMGDERGLILCLARLGDRWGDHTPTSVKWGEFETEAVVRAPRAGVIQFENPLYRIKSIQ